MLVQETSFCCDSAAPTIVPGTLRSYPSGLPGTSLIGGTTQGELVCSATSDLRCGISHVAIVVQIAFNGTHFGFGPLISDVTVTFANGTLACCVCCSACSRRPVFVCAGRGDISAQGQLHRLPHLSR